MNTVTDPPIQGQPLRPDFAGQMARLSARLRGPLPGREVYMQMAPENPMHRIVEMARAGGCREGAVLLLLYPHEGEAHIVLTQRSAELRNHAGQISLPGGRLEPGEDAVQGALREAWEEIGVPRDEVDVQGLLSELYIPPSNYCLQPVVASIPHRPDFQPHDAEVAAMLEAPLSLFTDPTNRHVETRLLGGVERTAPYYLVGTHKVWGATAMILTEFAAAWETMER